MTASGGTGAFLVWPWEDGRVEDPHTLKSDLDAFQKGGVTAVLAVPGARLRYDLADRKVVRAAAQAGQWARKRSIQFWFQADPRSASQSLISRTGERIQNLLIVRDAGSVFGPENLCMAPVRKGRFEIRCVYRDESRHTDAFGSRLGFEPDGIEKAFAFRLHNGTVLGDSVRDLTAEVRMFDDGRAGAIDLFGSAVCPDGEDWRVMVFPRFNTRLADPGGRENNDLLIALVESLFDGGALFDGVTWDRGGYGGDPGRLPVSLSLFNSFIAEYGYNLRDRLLGLVFPFDDGSHVEVRLHYRFLLTDLLRGGFRDLQAGLHGFFGSMGAAMLHGWEPGGGTFQSVPDPWRMLYPSAAGFAAVDAAEGMRQVDGRLNGRMILTKSLGVFSSMRSGLVRADLRDCGPQQIGHWTDLCGLHSLRWVADFIGPGSSPDTGLESFYEANRRLKAVESWTGLRFPDADTLVLYPACTLAAAGPESAASIADRLHCFIGKLASAGFQMDVASSPLLMAGRLSRDGFRIGFRLYRNLICPFPDVLEAETLERLQQMKRRNFPVVFAGGVPLMTSGGRPIPFPAEPDLDPEACDSSVLEALGLLPPIRLPGGGLGSVIRHAGEVLFLVCPAAPGGRIGGKAFCEGREVVIPESGALSIFRITPGREVEKVL
ncbi:hypothetical protein JW777_04500 [bacterium]|nr:hypothetical protein [bacterium]